MIQDIKIPDIGDFAEVPVIEISVEIGDVVALDDPIIMLESDKATLDIPSPCAGTISEILIAEGDLMSAGSLVMRIETEAATTAPTAQPDTPPAVVAPSENHTSLVVIGAGPGGYTAAFRAADLGRDVTLIDPRATLGGVCLNVGCIPSKALLHMAKVKTDAQEASGHGLVFGETKIDLDALRAFKEGVVDRLTGGLSGLAKRRKVRVIRGTATFAGAHSLRIEGNDDISELSFDQAIIAVGSEPVRLPFLPDDPRIMDSTGALKLADIPERLLVIGGGIIGLEMAQVYAALGSQIDIVEMSDQIIPGADKDLVTPLAKRISGSYNIYTNTKVVGVTAGKTLSATLEGPDGTQVLNYDRVLVAVGRTPNGAKVTPEAAGVPFDGSGFLDVNAQMQTAQPHIFAIGDVVGQPMLAHKAVHEAKVAAEVACEHLSAFEPACIPSVAYTDPEVAWVGTTETEAKEMGMEVKVAKFPWMASGRALSLGRDEGLTKLIIDPKTDKVIGGGIVGTNAGDLIAEVGLAIEMGADAEDIGLTIHPHPTLSETMAFAAESYLGTLTDL